MAAIDNHTHVTKGISIDYKTGAKLDYKLVEGRHSGEAMTSFGNSKNNEWLT